MTVVYFLFLKLKLFVHMIRTVRFQVSCQFIGVHFRTLNTTDSLFLADQSVRKAHHNFIYLSSFCVVGTKCTLFLGCDHMIYFLVLTNYFQLYLL